MQNRQKTARPAYKVYHVSYNLGVFYKGKQNVIPFDFHFFRCNDILVGINIPFNHIQVISLVKCFMS